MIIIHENTPEKDILLKAIKVEVVTSLTACPRLGLVWHNMFPYVPFGETVDEKFRWFRKEFLEFLAELKTPMIIDLLTCSLGSEDFKKEVREIEGMYSVKINYSLNETGGAVEADFIMESNGESVKDIYFNENIGDWKVSLGAMFW